MKKLWVVLLAPFSMAMMCGPGDDEAPPDSDICRSPASTGDVEAIRFVAVEWDNVISEGDLLPIRWGGQGVAMLGLRLEVDGPAIPDCLAHETELDGYVIDQTPLNMHGSGTTRQSGDLWLLLGGSPSGETTLRSTVYGVTREIPVTLDP